MPLRPSLSKSKPSPAPAKAVAVDYTADIDYQPAVQQQTAIVATRHQHPRWDLMTAPSQKFYIAKWKPSCFVDKTTRRWIRNAADERAAQEGYRFSEERGMFTVNWVTGNCILYEGDKAGLKMDIDDWQFEFFMSVFGWLGFSLERGRWIRRFTQAGVWIPKKNMKSPTLAATGLYLLCGDGERGQKCYSLARDFKQAMIAHSHATEMILAAQQAGEPLGRECTFHKSTGTITHEPSRSRYFVVAGENAQSTEGFNGSILVDETHVVDRDLMDRVKRAKISRSEPLHLEMSTAGGNTDGYGFYRYELGKRYAAAKTDRSYNPHFYFLDYSIDQKTPLESLYDRETVVKLGDAVNPTFGRGIMRGEFLEDWQDSVSELRELRNFAMYRLNLWLRSSEAWLPYVDWEFCQHQYTLRELMNSKYPCVGGLDLSKTKDMTALILMFAVPDPFLGVRPFIYPWFWIPEETVKLYENRIDFNQWSDHLMIVPGPTIDYTLVVDKLNWCNNNLDFRGVGFDPYNADTVVAMLEGPGYSWPESKLVSIHQTMRFMAPPSSEIERLILRHEICHNGNPVLNWQVGHCQVEEDKKGNKKPCKPQKDDYRKVDGVVALVMAQAMFLEQRLDQIFSVADSLLLYRNHELPDWMRKLSHAHKAA